MPDKRMRPPVRASKDGVLFDIHVIPSAKEESIMFADGVLKAKIREPADKGKANKAVLKLLKPLLGSCELVTGATSRDKTILVRNAETGAVNSVLDGLAGGR
jgi:uncharacterized protein (TIGR00251 family)